MPNASFTCSFGSCQNLGKFSVDSPLELIEYVLDKAKSDGDQIDSILVSGDFIEHDFKIGENGVTIDYRIEVILKIF